MSRWHRDNPEEYERFGGSPAERALGIEQPPREPTEPMSDRVREAWKDHPAECLDGPDGCEGEVAFREVPGREAMGLAPRSFPRCVAHYERAVESAQQTLERYGSPGPPSDFDPLDAGEAWGEDEY